MIVPGKFYLLKYLEEKQSNIKFFTNKFKLQKNERVNDIHTVLKL